MIPAFNEQETIEEVVKGIPKKVIGFSKVEVLVVDDGSTDKTLENARKAKADKIVKHVKNKGLGNAFRTGLDNALRMGADIIVNIDADGQFNPKDIERLCAPVLEGKADMATCSRFALKEFQPKMPLSKKIGNWLFTKAISVAAGKKFTDTQCGFRAYSRETALRMTLFGKFTYTQEVFMDLANKGFDIVEVPCKLAREQRKGKSKIVKNWFDYGLKAMLIIARSLRDYKPLAFFGSIGIIIFAIGTLAIATAFGNWLFTGETTPFTSLIPAGGAMLVLGFALVMLALIADMLGRQRKIQEEILYRLKKQEIEKEEKND